MTPYTNRLLGALTLGAVLAFGSAHAADEAKKPEPAAQKANPAPEKSDRAAQKAERRAAPKKAPGRTQDELDTCKHDAQGKDGPERANFMTKCLKDR